MVNTNQTNRITNWLKEGDRQEAIGYTTPLFFLSLLSLYAPRGEIPTQKLTALLVHVRNGYPYLGV